MHKNGRENSDTRDGLICAFVAFFLWGIFPLYFAVVKDVAALEVLVHRVIWAVPFGALIIHFRKQWPEVKVALTNRRTLFCLTLSAVFITINWLVYIWAVQIEQINQASLGYYMNPLLFTLAGVFVFGERLSLAQTTAIVMAAIGVAVLTFSGGQVPIVALILGVSFVVYGVIRKHVEIGGMPGLFIETLILLPVCLGYLLWLMGTGQAAFSAADPELAAILAFAGPLTVIPLLFFALAARRLDLTIIGMMQFLAPTLQFAVAVWFGEALTTAHIICFSLIWIAVVIFSMDAWRSSKASRGVQGATA